MKASRGSSLYEVLKSASRASGAPEGAAPATAPEAAADNAGGQSLQDRLAAYKAAKLASVQSPAPAESPAPVAVAVAPPPQAPVSSSKTVVLAPPPAPEADKMVFLDPLPTPAPVVPAPLAQERAVEVPAAASTPDTAPSGAAPDPGARVLRVNYNNAAFGALVVVGLLFIAYALGIRAGKAGAAAEASPAPRAAVLAPAPAVVPAPVAAPAPARPKSFTIRLAEWSYETPQERLKANAAADDYKRALERAGHRGIEKAQIKRGGKILLALFTGSFADLNSPEARAKMATLRAFKIQKATPFLQAAFEEAAD